MKFSIIIPVRGVNDFLKENIIHLNKLDYIDFEAIILTDNEENYDTKNPKIKLVAVGPLSPGKKRNAGAELATGDVLAFLDDDAYPTPNWLTNAKRVLEENTTYAIGGPAMTPQDASFLEKCSGLVLESWMASGDTLYRHRPQEERVVDDYPTVNLIVRKEAFWSIGGFDIKFWPGEDTILCLDLLKKFGKGFLYSPKPIVYHHRRTLFIPHLKQISRYGMHRGQFARIFPENSRLRLYLVPPLFVLGLVFGGITSYLFQPLLPFYFLVLTIYSVLLLRDSITAAVREKDMRVMPYVFVGIFLTHLIYGFNFIVGIIKQPKLALKRYDETTGNYVEG